MYVASLLIGEYLNTFVFVRELSTTNDYDIMHTNHVYGILICDFPLIHMYVAQVSFGYSYAFFGFHLTDLTPYRYNKPILNHNETQSSENDAFCFKDMRYL